MTIDCIGVSSRGRTIFRSLRLLCGPALLAGVTACHGLLDVTDPTKIQESDIANASGAKSEYVGVVQTFHGNIVFAATRSSYWADERTFTRPGRLNPNYSDEEALFDRHDAAAYEAAYSGTSGNGLSDPYLANLDVIVGRSSVAIRAMRAYGDSATKGDFLAHLFAIRAAAMVQIAEDVCSGFPINDIDDKNLPVYSTAYTTQTALTSAVGQLDSALAHGRDSVRIMNFAQVLKGRALLDLGQWDAAAAAVHSVPTNFVYTTIQEQSNTFYYPYHDDYWGAVGDTEGTNGLPFVSAHDPRVPTAYIMQRPQVPQDSLFDQLKYTSYHDPITLASGVEARLIEAEAAIHAGQPDAATTTLNALRSAVSGLPALTTPSTTAAQIDTLYKERAFWLFLTGRRLGDMRRLVRLYGRDPATLYPKGAYWYGAPFGVATAIPFVLAANQYYNSNITTGCTGQ